MEQKQMSQKRKKPGKSASRSLFKGKKSAESLRALKEKKKKAEREDSFKEKKSFLSAKKTTAVLESRLAEAKKDYLYLKADFENYKKNVLKEKSDLIQYGGQRLVTSLAEEVLDDFDRAFQLSSEKESLENFKNGMRFIHLKFNRILKNFGVTIEDPTGQPFDPERHEALSRQKSAEVPEGHVIAALKKAYKLHDRLIRPAQVIISEGDGKKNNGEAPSSILKGDEEGAPAAGVEKSGDLSSFPEEEKEALSFSKESEYPNTDKTRPSSDPPDNKNREDPTEGEV